MSLGSPEQMPERSVSTLKEEWSAQPVLKPEQVRAGVNTIARSKCFAPASRKHYRIRGLRSFPNIDAQQLIRLSI